MHIRQLLSLEGCKLHCCSWLILKLADNWTGTTGVQGCYSLLKVCLWNIQHPQWVCNWWLSELTTATTRQLMSIYLVIVKWMDSYLMYMLQVKSNLRTICFNLGQLDFFCYCCSCSLGSMLFLLSLKCCCIVVWQTKMHSVCEKCFSCRLSLWKRHVTKFSHTEWETWVRARMLVSRSVTWVSFLFLPDSATVFPTLPPLSELLPRVHSGSVSTLFW